MASLPFTLMRHLIFRAQQCKYYTVKGCFQKRTGHVPHQFRPYCCGIGRLYFPSKISLLTVILSYFLAVQIMSLQSINHHLKKGRFRLQKHFVLRVNLSQGWHVWILENWWIWLVIIQDHWCLRSSVS